MLTLLKNNFGLKVLSVCLALAAWGYFHLAAAPGTIARFDQSLLVPIVVTGLRPGYQANYPLKNATVVIEAPRNGPEIKPEQFRAVLDVTDLDLGEHSVPVKIVSPDVPVKQVQPGTVSVTIDRLDQRTVPISFDYVGERRNVVVDAPAVSPATTTLRGVASELNRVAGVRVEIPIPAKPQQFDAMIRPTPTDARGAEITGVQVSPNLVRVRANFVAPSAAHPATPH